jgi:hypothetical protein
MMRRLSLLLCILFLASLGFSQQPVSLALQPVILQSHPAASSGSVASLTNAFSSNNLKGNSIIVVFANGNGNNAAAPISDTNSNTYSKATQVAVIGNLFEAEIWYATNVAAGANTVTVTPGGSAASIASEVYEVSGLLALNPQVLDQTNSATGNSTTPSTNFLPTVTNELAFAAFAVGTAAQTITVASPYTNDSGQQNPTTPAGLFSFVSASSYLANTTATIAGATIVSEPWTVALASFRTLIIPIQGSVVATQISAANLNATVVQGTGANLHAVTDPTSETNVVTTATTTDSALGCYVGTGTGTTASTNSAFCKASSGNFYGVRAVNTTSTLAYLRLYNATSAPTCSSATNFIESIPVPASATGAGFQFVSPIPIGYSTGIAYCVTGGGANTDNTNAPAGVYITLYYK